MLVILWYFHRAYYTHGFDVTSSRIKVKYWGQQTLNLTEAWQYDSCGTSGCTYDGVCLFMYVLLRICTQFYDVLELCNICDFCSYCYLHRNVIIVHNIIKNNSLKRSSFSQSDVTDGHNIYLGVVHQTIDRTFNCYNMYSSWKINPVFYPTYYVSCDYCCVTLVSLFITLRHPRDFTSHTSRRGTLR